MTGVLRVAALPFVPSPCTDVCRIDAQTGWCAGCMRTIDEIAVWGGLDDAAKRAVWKRLALRRAELAPDNGPASNDDQGAVGTPAKP